MGGGVWLGSGGFDGVKYVGDFGDEVEVVG